MSVVFVYVVVVGVMVVPRRPVSRLYAYVFWNSSSVNAGRPNPPVEVYVSGSRKDCAAEPELELGPPCCGVVVDRSLLVCVLGREGGPACLLLVLDARVCARSGLGWKALFARPVAEVWMRVASEGGAGEGGGWDVFEVEVEDDGAGAGAEAGVLEFWGLELGLPRIFSGLLMALVFGFGIRDYGLEV